MFEHSWVAHKCSIPPNDPAAGQSVRQLGTSGRLQGAQKVWPFCAPCPVAEVTIVGTSSLLGSGFYLWLSLRSVQKPELAPSPAVK